TERLGEGIRALYVAAAHLPHVAGVGTITYERDDHLILVYADPLGTAAYKVRTADVSEPFRPSPVNLRPVRAHDLDATPLRLVESRLRLVGFAEDIREEHGAREALVFDVPGCDPPASLIVGIRGKTPLDDSQIAQLSALTPRAAGFLNAGDPPEREVP